MGRKDRMETPWFEKNVSQERTELWSLRHSSRSHSSVSQHLCCSSMNKPSLPSTDNLLYHVPVLSMLPYTPFSCPQAGHRRMPWSTDRNAPSLSLPGSSSSVFLRKSKHCFEIRLTWNQTLMSLGEIIQTLSLGLLICKIRIIMPTLYTLWGLNTCTHTPMPSPVGAEKCQLPSLRAVTLPFD